jgi:hypothetical protein
LQRFLTNSIRFPQQSAIQAFQTVRADCNTNTHSTDTTFASVNTVFCSPGAALALSLYLQSIFVTPRLTHALAKIIHQADMDQQTGTPYDPAASRAKARAKQRSARAFALA